MRIILAVAHFVLIQINTQLIEVQGIDKGIIGANRMVFGDILINALRKKNIEVTELDGVTNLVESESGESDEGINYEVAKVLQAIDQISEGCRTVLNLYLFDGYDHNEIAQILNISESASKAQYSKAKAKVRKIMADENRMS